MNTDVLTLASLSTSLPAKPSRRVERDNLLQGIDSGVSSGRQLIVIQGEEGTGKTTLLADYVRLHSENTISVFISSSDRLSYHPDTILLSLCSQLFWFVHQREIHPEDPVDEAALARLFGLAQTKARRSSQQMVIVLDGICDVPEIDFRRQIASMVHPGREWIVVLASRGPDDELPWDTQRFRWIPITVPVFSFEETRLYFSDLTNDVEFVTRVNNSFRGLPSHLSAVRRLLEERETDIRELIGSRLETTFEQLFELSWRYVDTSNGNLLRLLGVLAHDRRRRTLPDLCRIVGMDATDAANLVSGLPFVELNAGDQVLSFVSDEFQRFVESRLMSIKNECIDLIIAGLVRVVDSAESIAALPHYYHLAGRPQEVLDSLSPNRISRILEVSQSIVSLQSTIDLGARAARQLDRHSQIFQFSLQKSALSQLATAESWRPELEARIALNDFDAARALAYSIIPKEDKLHALAVLSSALRKRGNEAPPELQAEIERLFEEVDAVALGERSVDIAADLLHYSPQLAISLVERSAQSIGENALDWAFVKLSFRALDKDQRSTSEADHQDSLIREIRTRIQNPATRTLPSAVSLLIGDHSASDVIQEVNGITGVGSRLFVLREWTKSHAADPDAVQVAEHAVQLMISSVEYAPNATVLADLASPIRYLDDQEQVRRLVDIFQRQSDALDGLGPLQDFVRLQTFLICAALKSNPIDAAARSSVLFHQVQHEADISLRADCAAIFLAALEWIDPELELETLGEVHTNVNELLNASIQAILDSTALQEDAVAGVVRALAATVPEKALELALRLNTEERRDSTLLVFVDAVSNSPASSIPFRSVLKALDSIKKDIVRGNAIVTLLEGMAVESQSPRWPESDFASIVEHVCNLESAAGRLSCHCSVYRALHFDDDNAHSSIRERVVHGIESSWKTIEASWRKVDMGFDIIRSVSRNNRELAVKYLQETEQLQKDLVSQVDVESSGFSLCVDLLIRSFSGLLARDVATTNDLERVSRLVSSVEDAGEGVSLWARLAACCFTKSRMDWGKLIVNSHLVPAVQGIRVDDAAYRYAAIIDAVPVIFAAHPKVSLNMINELPETQKHEAMNGVLHFLTFGYLMREPFSHSSGWNHSLSYSNIIDIIDVLGVCDHDALIYTYVEQIARSLSSRSAHHKYSGQQRQEIVRLLLSLIDSKFPDAKRIRHNGFKIAAKAQVERVERKGPQRVHDLIEEARDIPNISDRAYVLGIIASCLPQNRKSQRRELFGEAIELIDQLPVSTERLYRFVALASLAIDSEQDLCRNFLRMAMSATMRDDDSTVLEMQRQVISLAHRLDPAFAASLASTADDDPARRRTKRNLTRHMHKLQTEQELGRFRSSNNDTLLIESTHYPSAAWAALGRLNAGRIDPIHMDQVTKYVEIAARLPLAEAYPILAWAIENANKRLERTDQARSYLRDLFTSTLLAAEFAFRISTRHVRTIQFSPIEESAKFVIGESDRERALQFIGDWIALKKPKYLKISDPYFCRSDLDLLRLIQQNAPDCRVEILTSLDAQRKDGLRETMDQAFRDYWRINVSEQSPPDTDVVIVGVEPNGDSPVHDRWWVTEGAGISLGTSFNSLGSTKLSGITELTKDQAADAEASLDRYLGRSERIFKGRAIRYSLFTL